MKHFLNELISAGNRRKNFFLLLVVLVSSAMLHTEMKYFFKDYKNYYYLPMEHMAIHKSMAAYVDDAHKEKATKDNAFTTETGSFIPCPPGFHGEIFYDTDLKGNRFLSDSTELHEKCEQSHAYILAVLNKLF